VLKAVKVVIEEGIAEPILLGNHATIQSMLDEYNILLPGVQIIDPKNCVSEKEKADLADYSQRYFEKQQRKGISQDDALQAVRTGCHYGAFMVETGEADAMIGGLTRRFPETVRPALQIVGARDEVNKVAGMHIVMTKSGPLFLADTTINHHLNAQDLADVTELVESAVRSFDIEPKIALVTYSNFGAVPDGETAQLMSETTAILHERHPDWIVDGEMQAHLALRPEIRQKYYPFSKLGDHKANVLIFPNLSSANIAYNLIGSVTDVDVIGPVLLGLKKPVHVLQLGSSVRKIVDMVGIAAIDAQANAQ